MKFLRFAALGLALLVSFDAVAGGDGKLTRLGEDVQCLAPAPEDWSRGSAIGFAAALEPFDVKFKGKADLTAALTQTVLTADGSAYEQVGAAVLFVDSGEDKSDVERRHAQKIWRWMKRNVSVPLVLDWGWSWKIPDEWDSGVDYVHMLILPDSVGVIVECE